MGKKKAIHVDIYIEKGKIRVNVDNRSQINIISLKAVERLRLDYYEKVIPLKIRVADRVITSYSGGQILIETPLLPVVIEGRKFEVNFNIILLRLTDVILR